ncbi:MAG TPA: hypothetical protein VLQ91_05815 [Draconibacterium sp.]|nr:hypothetical protein [Draconibacterium sp.]
MEKIGKKITIVLWVLVIVSVILIVSLMANINPSNDQDPAMLSWINANLIWVYILGIIAAGLAVLFAIYHTVSDKQAAKGGLISLAFLGGVALISYLSASPEIPQFLGVDKFIAAGLNGQTMKFVDTGLIALYIMLAISILGFIVGPIIRIVRK